jgi:hypothetical protein
MQIDVARLWKSEEGITGTFSVDGEQKYFSLELPELFEGQPNVPDKTCILPGTYEVQRLWSAHWNQMMPHVVGTPGLYRNRQAAHLGHRNRRISGSLRGV